MEELTSTQVSTMNLDRSECRSQYNETDRKEEEHNRPEKGGYLDVNANSCFDGVDQILKFHQDVLDLFEPAFPTAFDVDSL